MCSLKEWRMFFICGNVFIILLGSILSFTSATDTNNFENFEDVIKNNDIFFATNMGAKVCIGVGILMSFSASLGIIAVLTKGHLTMFLYSILIFMVGLIFFVCGCFGVSCADRHLEHKIQYQLRLSFGRRYNNTSIKKSYERMEMKYFCCGIVGPNDYKIEFQYRGQPDMVPYSCCNRWIENEKDINETNCPISKAWNEGCASVIMRLFVTLFLNMGCIAIPAGALMLIFGITTLWKGSWLLLL